MWKNGAFWVGMKQKRSQKWIQLWKPPYRCWLRHQVSNSIFVHLELRFLTQCIVLLLCVVLSYLWCDLIKPGIGYFAHTTPSQCRSSVKGLYGQSVRCLICQIASHLCECIIFTQETLFPRLLFWRYINLTFHGSRALTTLIWFLSSIYYSRSISLKDPIPKKLKSNLYTHQTKSDRSGTWIHRVKNFENIL